MTPKPKARHYVPTKAAESLPQNLPVMLTTKHVAQLLNVSAKHVRDMLARGEIQGVKCGDCWRVPRDKFLTQYGLAGE